MTFNEYKQLLVDHGHWQQNDWHTDRPHLDSLYESLGLNEFDGIRITTVVKVEGINRSDIKR